MRARLENACGGRRAAVALALVFLLGLGLRLDYAIRAPQHPVDDARAYARISRALYEGEGYTQGPGFGYLQSASNYQPGLPLFVTGLYEVRRAPDERFARIVLALLSSLAIPFAFAIGRRLGGPVGRRADFGGLSPEIGPSAAVVAGLMAATVVAVYPALLEYTGMLMTEPVGTALLAGTVLLLLRARERERPWPWAATGLAIGALAMLRPEYLLLVLVLPALMLLPWHRDAAGRGRRLRLAALMAGCALLVLAPWTVRNFIAFERLVPVSTGGGQVLYEGSYLPAGPNPENITDHLLAEYPWIRRQLGPLPGPIYRGQAVAALAHRLHPGENTDTALTGMAIDAYWTAARSEPLDLAGFLAGKVWFAWTDPARGVMRFPLWRALQIALLAAAALGLAVSLARRRFDVAAIAAVLLVVTLVQGLYIASPRRTLTLLPLTSALAGYGAVWLWAQIWKVGPRVSQKRSEYSPAST